MRGRRFALDVVARAAGDVEEVEGLVVVADAAFGRVGVRDEGAVGVAGAALGVVFGESGLCQSVKVRALYD